MWAAEAEPGTDRETRATKRKIIAAEALEEANYRLLQARLRAILEAKGVDQEDGGGGGGGGAAMVAARRNLKTPYSGPAGAACPTTTRRSSPAFRGRANADDANPGWHANSVLAAALAYAPGVAADPAAIGQAEAVNHRDYDFRLDHSTRHHARGTPRPWEDRRYEQSPSWRAPAHGGREWRLAAVGPRRPAALASAGRVRVPHRMARAATE